MFLGDWPGKLRGRINRRTVNRGIVKLQSMLIADYRTFQMLTENVLMRQINTSAVIGLKTVVNNCVAIFEACKVD